MRTIIKNTVAVAMIAGAALAVSACGKTENTNITETNVTDMNTMAPEEGTMNDMSGMEMGNESNSSNMM
ncbi:hypothetical protein [Sphingomonas sp.]|uniref:hypothetical protein n=1 Tax=Sphingomonas sp. TaxID=28214 RepID=UPI000DB02D5D|nr:hypothetical protein [Sphingomonas sp.]PZU07935.1 MAG: hypothetical protein DI605_13685 [Sphingomonas sp.]